jgi:hypothetical protein
MGSSASALPSRDPCRDEGAFASSEAPGPAWPRSWRAGEALRTAAKSLGGENIPYESVTCDPIEGPGVGFTTIPFIFRDERC